MSIIKQIFTFINKHRDELGLVFGLSLYMLIAIIFNLPCPIKFITGISCPGCGMTRAVISLCKLDFDSAWHYHPLVFLLIPIAITIYILSVKKLIKARKVFLICVAVLFLAVYLYRFIVIKSDVLVFEPQNGLFLGIIPGLFSS